MPQKKSFCQKNFEFHARVQKCHFGRMKNCQNGTFEPVREIKKKKKKKKKNKKKIKKKIS